MKSRYLIISCLGILLVTSTAFASLSTDAFQKLKNVEANSIKIPTVVEIPFDNDYVETNLFAVYNKTRSSFEPYYFKKTVSDNSVPVTAETENGYDAESVLMIDNNLVTYKEFPVSGDKQGQSRIILKGVSPITSSSLSMMLERYVALPNTIEIRASLNGAEKVVLATQRLNSNSVSFPKTTADRWTVTLTYGQPLRITELLLRQEGSKSSSQGLRFLAQPNNSYVVYFNPDRYVSIAVGESGNLSSNNDVVRLGEIMSQNNPSYAIADTDMDNVPDIRDNCVDIQNPDQADINNNGRGDVCDDFDKDGIINLKDNCKNDPNQNQIDTDNDGIGDACDGAESRLTEKYKFIPWVGIAFAMITIIILFAITFKRKE